MPHQQFRKCFDADPRRRRAANRLQRRAANDLGTEEQTRPGSMQPPRRELWNTLLMRERDARARNFYLTYIARPDNRRRSLHKR
jgi:hypothetical protein